MLQLKDGFRAHTAHIFDSILITNIVRPFDCVIHMPTPIIIGIGTSDGTGDTTLGRNGVRTGRKNLGNNGCFITRLCQLKSSSHACTTATNNDTIIGKRSNICHTALTPITAICQMSSISFIKSGKICIASGVNEYSRTDTMNFTLILQ